MSGNIHLGFLRHASVAKMKDWGFSAMRADALRGSHASRIATALPCLQRLHVLHQIRNLRRPELRGDAVGIPTTAASEAVAQGRRAAIMQEGRVERNTAQRGHLQA